MNSTETEISLDSNKKTKVSARREEASASEDGRSISLLVSADKKECAFPITITYIQQFKWGIGVAIARGNATHTLARLH